MSAPTAIHPHLPRFSQAVTGVLAVEAVAFQDRWVVAVALGLVGVSLLVPRWSPVPWLFRLIARPPAELEPAAPARFSQAIAFASLAAALALIVTGPATAGWILVGIVAAVALLSASTGYCVGCEIYRLILRPSARDDDVRAGLGLTGGGPWLLVVTAPGCARCEPVARQLEEVAAREVVRVDLARTPAATRLAVSSVPAVVAVGVDGLVRLARAGRLERSDLEEIAAAV